MPGIHITDIEAAINYWRERSPSPDGVTLAPELRAWPRSMPFWFSTMRKRLTRPAFRPRPWPPGRSGTTPRPTRPALQFAQQARATHCAKAAAEVLTRYSTGRPCRRVKSAPVGGASRLKAVRGALAVMQTGPWRKSPWRQALPTAPFEHAFVQAHSLRS